jgi:hypothetical protein
MLNLFRNSQFLLFGVLFVCVLAFAQISGDLLIQVTDPSGATVPNATVTLTSRETGSVRTLVTGSDGSARFTQLNVGSYSIRVETAGFTTFETTATVNSGAVVSVPIALEVKRAQQEIVVTEVASTLNTVNAQLQNTTESQKIVELPIAAGGVLALSATVPGVAPVTPNNPFLGLGSFNSNGGRGRGNNITLDNATATDVSTTGGSGLGTVPLEGIKEFNVITNNFNAEYGRNSSAQVQILTKGGTNEFHGSLFEYFRNDKMNARAYFDRTGSPSIERNNDFGVVAGLPIMKNKLFGFGTYEEVKVRGAGATVIATVPKPSDLTNLDPTSKALMDKLQVPTSPTGTISESAPNTTNNYAFSARGDWNITDKDVMFARMGRFGQHQNRTSLTFINSNLPTNGAGLVTQAYNGTISETHIFGPRVVNQFQASFGRSAPVFQPLFSFGGPEIDFNDGTSFFGTWAGVPQGRVQNTYQYNDIVTFTQGSHQLKFGAEVERIQANSFFDSNVRGTLTFLTIADFVAGKPFQYVQRFGNSVRGNRIWNESFFAQDDWRVRRDLTINLGVRLEVAGPTSEVNGILSNLDLSNNQPLGGAGTGPLGSFDVGGTYTHTNYNWAPRFGFAWNPHGGKLVVRGGYGIAYDFIFLNPITNGRFLPPFMYSFTLPNTGINGANSYAALVAGTSAFQATSQATVGNFGTTIKNFGGIGPIDQGLRNPQVQQWSLTVEREIGQGLLLRGSYVGTKGNFLQRTRPINTIAAGVFTPPQTPAEEAAMQAAGVFTQVNAGLNAPLTASSNRIDPRFNAVNLVESSANSNYHSMQLSAIKRFSRWYEFTASYAWSKSIDDVSDVLGVLANDSASQQNPFNNRNNRAVSQFDVTHRTVITHNFRVPTFSGHSAFVRYALGGWEFNGIFQAQTGLPINIVSGARGGVSDPLLIGGGGVVRPDLVGPLNIHFDANPGLGTKNPNKIPTSGLAQPLVGHFGTLGRNVVRVNPLINTDWTLGKRFPVTERINLEFQAQMFNVFNNTTFNFGSSLNSLAAPATFGYYSGTDFAPRNVTLVMRLNW